LIYRPKQSEVSTRGKELCSFRSKWVRFGAFLAMSVVLLPALIFIHKFLAVSSPVGQGILVVEAWIPPRTLAESLRTFNSGRYSYVIVVGGPIQGNGRTSHPAKTYDEVAAKELANLGLDPNRLVRITVPPVEEGYRTLASAAAVKRWLGDSDSPAFVDVFTAGVHARKSWAVFRYALGQHYRVGIISGNEYIYNPRLWFFSSTGIWYVIRDFAGFVYSKFWIPFNTQDLVRVPKSADLAPRPGASPVLEASFRRRRPSITQFRARSSVFAKAESEPFSTSIP
jgi:hypothetical protein